MVKVEFFISTTWNISGMNSAESIRDKGSRGNLLSNCNSHLFKLRLEILSNSAKMIQLKKFPFFEQKFWTPKFNDRIIIFPEIIAEYLKDQ